jgi:sucrose-6-phosphate hydrolase SacC (GH32 family)
MMTTDSRSLLLTALLLSPLSARGNEIPIGNITTASYGDWSKTGTAFDRGPATGALLPKLEIENAGDAPVISSEIEDDGPTGTLTSPEFTISLPFISYRIGGGDYERHACINLLIDGKIVRSATGRNTDRLAPGSWDVSAFAGKTAKIEVIDQASGTWGHVNVARIVQTDSPEQRPVTTQPLYQETLRPQFHFTARQWTMDRLNPGQRQEGWINDLNGLIYYDGEYHLFAQRWNKCWIHAVSRDLIHWTELEPAFWEDKLDSGVQSGTCVVDFHNTSGLATDPRQPAMVAFHSGNDNRSQSISYSLDHGRTWQSYSKNPVLSFPERDPKVFWYEPGKHWVMFLYGGGQYHIFTSSNLLDWKDEKHPIPHSYECPDFFELPVDGKDNDKKWVLIHGDGKYSLGTFNGHEFKSTSDQFPADINEPNFYATQSWSNVDKGRRVQTAWLRGSDFPAMPFNQQITFPCELTLRTTPVGLRLFREPIHEIESLQGEKKSFENRSLKPGEKLDLVASGDLYRLQADVEIPDGSSLKFIFRGIPVILTSKTIQVGKKSGQTIDGVHTVEVLLDRASLEAFVNHGEISSTNFVLPASEGLSVTAEGGPARIRSLTLHPLTSAWK